MGTERYMVFLSKNHKFKYYDEAKIKLYKTNFVPPTRRLDMTFSEFVKKLRDWKPGDERFVYGQHVMDLTGIKCLLMKLVPVAAAYCSGCKGFLTWKKFCLITVYWI